MKAVVYDKKGSPEKLIYKEIDKPEPGDNEVLIRIFASSVNAADYRSMNMGIIPKRRIFGADIAGLVETAGRDTIRFKPGDEVIGDLSGYGFGGFAEYVAVPEEVLTLKPQKLSFEEAAALPLAAVTALQALRKGQIRKGQKVLIAGSGGGVGSYAVQLAKYYGAEVTGVCSTKNAEQTKTIGADYVIDYTTENFTKTDRRYDIILAVNGNQSLSAYRRILNRNGICVMVGGSLVQIFMSLLFGRLLSFGSKKIFSLSAKSNRTDLEFIAKLAGDGMIRPVIDRRYPLEKTADAMKYLGEGHARGKVVIMIND
jgi:NADPH:quinone reductase-like Zn-dependent oxidoreductase